MTITEAEARRREREAFMAGAEYRVTPREHTQSAQLTAMGGHLWDQCVIEADRRYAEIPTPAPAKEPERNLEGIYYYLDDLMARICEKDKEIYALTARVRALEGK